MLPMPLVVVSRLQAGIKVGGAWFNATVSAGSSEQVRGPVKTLTLTAEVPAGFAAKHGGGSDRTGLGPKPTATACVDLWRCWVVLAVGELCSRQRPPSAPSVCGYFVYVDACVALRGSRARADVPARFPIVLFSSGSYAWAPIPMMNAYDLASGLPVLPWNRTIAP